MIDIVGQGQPVAVQDAAARACDGDRPLLEFIALGSQFFALHQRQPGKLHKEYGKQHHRKDAKNDEPVADISIHYLYSTPKACTHHNHWNHYSIFCAGADNCSQFVYKLLQTRARCDMLINVKSSDDDDVKTGLSALFGIFFIKKAAKGGGPVMTFKY